MGGRAQGRRVLRASHKLIFYRLHPPDELHLWAHYLKVDRNKALDGMVCVLKGNGGLRTNRPKGVQWLTVEAFLVRWHRKPKGPSRERAVERRSNRLLEVGSQGALLEPTSFFCTYVI